MATIFQLPIRFFAFTIGLFFYWMEIASDWIIGARSITEYVRTGSCKRCGRCCRLLALEMPHVISKRDVLVRLFSWWHRFSFNFHYEGREKNWLIYHCGYFLEGNPAGCRIYHFRHRLCRFYPRQRLYGHPKTHPECGYQFVRRDGKPTFDDILKEKKDAKSSLQLSQIAQ